MKPLHSIPREKTIPRFDFGSIFRDFTLGSTTLNTTFQATNTTFEHLNARLRDTVRNTTREWTLTVPYRDAPLDFTAFGTPNTTYEVDFEYNEP